MSLKDELEIIRDGCSPVLTGDPMDIPCIETSDPERLCKHPVVSVHMITYNHEPYIRQAIEGVMMQKTNFEFELVIGEDCSTDKTREICFEYQKRYPDKIRVLWCDHNLYCKPHPAGGNSERNIAHCRGEFIAFCEGDDYWTDPLKLQKQVDLIRTKDAIMCVAFTQWMWPDGHGYVNWYEKKELITIDDFMKQYFHTSTYVIRRDMMITAQRKYSKIINWYDVMWVYCISSLGTVCLLPEVVSVYRKTSTGVSAGLAPEEYAKLVAKQNFELYLYGPDQVKSYALALTQKMVDVEFYASRRYYPSVYLQKSWRDLISTHYMLRKLETEKSLLKEVRYWTNVCWFFARQFLVLIGLGFLLKK